MSQGIRRTFIELFNDQPFTDVVIPIIQRDYAQGRKSAEDVRTQFLESLFLTLNLSDGDPTLPLDLDFVYGSLEGDDQKTFCLLDGQQRLTTLFLMHWYLAALDGKSDDFRSRMLLKGHSRFSYKVRPSSQEFCDALVKHDVDLNALLSADQGCINVLSKALENESWFFLSWRQDPTIMSALEMLNSIHLRFKGTEGLYDKITCVEKPYITFQFLNLHDFGLSDDLYIKMNSRGKPLTVFEVFKAQVEQVIKKELPDVERNLGGTKVSLVDYFSRKVDTEWSDLFWGYRDKKTHLFDRQFMNFIRGVALVFYTNEHPNLAEAEVNRVLEILADTKNDIGFLQYIQNDCLTPGFLVALIDILDRVSGSKGLNTYLNDEFYYHEREAFSRILEGRSSTYTDWVQFFGYCAFLVWGQERVDGSQFNEWQRLISNLARYTTYNRVDEFRQSIVATKRLLDELSDQNVVDFIASSTHTLFSGFNRQQAREERLKAQLMLCNQDWSEMIRSIERHGYFKGQIEFLLKFSGVLEKWLSREEKSDWDKVADEGFRQVFRTYCHKAEVIFDNNGLKNFPDFLWERALLSVGDYLLKISRNFSFLDNTDRDVSWKRLLRGSDQAEDNFNTKRDYVEILFDQVDPERVVESLQDVVKLFLDNEATRYDWRAKIIECPACISYCGKRQIRRQHGKIYLLSKIQMNGSHAELFTFNLKYYYLDPMMVNNGLDPFNKVTYWETYTESDEPDVFLCFEAQNLFFQIDREGNAYQVSLYHWDTDEEDSSLPDTELLQALVNVGLQFEEDQEEGWITLLADDGQLKSVVEQVIEVVRGVY